MVGAPPAHRAMPHTGRIGACSCTALAVRCRRASGSSQLRVAFIEPGREARCWPGRGRPHGREGGPGWLSFSPSTNFKWKFLFQFDLNLIQTSRIHIKLNFHPKFMKLVLLTFYFCILFIKNIIINSST
jgi:hypothetical protein